MKQRAKKKGGKNVRDSVYKKDEQGRRQLLGKSVKRGTENITEKLVMRKHLEQKAHDSNLIASIMHACVKRRHLILKGYGGQGTEKSMLKPARRRHPRLERNG